MVYVKAWTDFQSQAEALYLASPSKTRYVVKYRAVDGKLVLKVTDDVSTLSFKTAHSVYLGRFEALTLSLTQKMQNHRPPPPIVTPTPTAKISSLVPPVGVSTPAGGSRSGTPMPEDTSGGGVGATGTAGGGTKKKPKKKKK